MKVKENSNGDSTSRITYPLSRIGWVSLVLSLASKASAFSGASRILIGGEALSCTFQRGASTGLHGNANIRPNGALPASDARLSSSLHAGTRLQFRDGDDDPSTPVGTGRSTNWWNTIFASKEEIANNEQDNVDDYLEFLDRRYKRLHSDEKEEEAKSFSALNWLMQGSQKREVSSTQQQKDDALYVLAVAGLASQRLLQKHHLQQEVEEAEKMSQSPTVDVAAGQVVDVVVSTDHSPSTIFIKKFVVPLIRVLYILQRRKELLVAAQTQRVKTMLRKVARAASKSLVAGPITTCKAVLEIGGGKKNLAATVAAATTLFLLLRPLLKAAVTEGSVGA